MEDVLSDPSVCLKKRVYNHAMRSLDVFVSNAFLLPRLGLVLYLPHLLKKKTDKRICIQI